MNPISVKWAHYRRLTYDCKWLFRSIQIASLVDSRFDSDPSHCQKHWWKLIECWVWGERRWRPHPKPPGRVLIASRIDFVRCAYSLRTPPPPPPPVPCQRSTLFVTGAYQVFFYRVICWRLDTFDSFFWDKGIVRTRKTVVLTSGWEPTGFGGMESTGQAHKATKSELPFGWRRKSRNRVKLGDFFCF